MFENFTPIKDNLFVKTIQEDQKTESGLYIPGSANKSTVLCSVIAIGEKVSLVSVGDTVLVPKGYGIDLEDDYKIIKEDAVLGKI